MDSPSPARRRPPLFPVFGADELARLVTVACMVFNQAQRAGNPNIARVAYLLLSREEYRRPFLRWCWLKRYDVLTPEKYSPHMAFIEWGSLNHPDGHDCCLQCGNATWTVEVVPQLVPVATGGVVVTDQYVGLGRCTARGCGESRLIDVLA